MILTRKQILRIFSAVNALQDTQRNYDFGHKTRYKMFKAHRILSGRVEDLEKARVALVREIAPRDLAIKPGTAEMNAFSDKWEAFLNETEEVNGLAPFALNAELRFDINKIPVAVLCDLGDLLLDEAPVD